VYHGFIRDTQGNVTPFDVTGSINTYATGINANGVVMGLYEDANFVDQGFARDTQGNVTPFQPLRKHPH